MLLIPAGYLHVDYCVIEYKPMVDIQKDIANIMQFQKKKIIFSINFVLHYLSIMLIHQLR